MKRLGCSNIGHTVALFSAGMTHCCDYHGKFVERTDDFANDLLALKTDAAALNAELAAGNKTGCDCCPNLTYGEWDDSFEIKGLILTCFLPDVMCNFGCTYCSVKGRLGEVRANRPGILAVLQECEKLGLNLTALNLSAGEIAMFKDCDEILNIILRNNWKCLVFTNAAIYKQGISDLLKSGNAKLYVSLDSGTKESFAKIKQRDLFDKVVGNLQKYSENGSVWLKYLFLPGLNDNDEDINGFLDICKQLSVAHITVAADLMKKDTRMPAETFEKVISMLSEIKRLMIPYNIDKPMFNPDDLKCILEWEESRV